MNPAHHASRYSAQTTGRFGIRYGHFADYQNKYGMFIFISKTSVELFIVRICNFNQFLHQHTNRKYEHLSLLTCLCVQRETHQWHAFLFSKQALVSAPSLQAYDLNGALAFHDIEICMTTIVNNHWMLIKIKVTCQDTFTIVKFRYCNKRSRNATLYGAQCCDPLDLLSQRTFSFSMCSPPSPVR